MTFIFENGSYKNKKQKAKQGQLDAIEENSFVEKAWLQVHGTLGVLPA